MKKYYVSANTAEGFVNYIHSNVEELNQVIILKHPSHTLKTSIIHQMIDYYKSQREIEVLLSPLGKKYLDGVIIREKSLAIINDRISTPDLAGAIEIDCSLFMKHRPVLDTDLEEKFTYYNEEAYKNFATGLKVHDDLEKIYINEMDFERADELADDVIQEHVEKREKQRFESKVYHRLFGTNTVDGVVNEIPHLIENISTVYYIKGRAGTGKSTLMKKVSKACENKGYGVELYHCSFDPNSLDMVLVRELGLCIFDSTDPHEFFPNREGEKVIDVYEEAVTPGTDEKYESQINQVNREYKSYMKQGIVELKKAGEYLEKIEDKFGFSKKEITNISEFLKEQIIQK
ncbi:hypothetical protein [Oceanobacillus halophilus]|uniref:ATPase n=1 Tax=Oceanobacillus halophilus TaxID=930130 RepID=A0A495A7J9_9BACI|nr:hypothetical protein [Oceanobacillus halophilus]RKQ35594.1 hypothetical protein D8M06_04790 [Oceanobacillus halophilus]